jgi:RNA polymerase sigma-70 factor (ECF subfamily)
MARSTDPGSERSPQEMDERAAFRKQVTPYLGELLAAARHELRYHRALGDLDPEDPTPSEIIGDVLTRAWQERKHWSPEVGTRTRLYVLLFRVVKNVVHRQKSRRSHETVSIEALVPPEDTYDDDESFWEWYQPDEMLRWEDVIETPALSPEQAASADEEFARALGPREREIYLMVELYGLPLGEVALALGMSLEEAARRVADARKHLDVLEQGRIP